MDATERELFIKASQGDKDARKKIIERYKPMIDIIMQKKGVNPNQYNTVRKEAIRLLNHYIDNWKPDGLNRPLTFLYDAIGTKMDRL